MRRYLTRLLPLIALAGALSACSASPATGKMQFVTLSEEQEIRLGAEAEQDFLKEGGGELPSPEINQYVSDLGQRLAAVSERPDLPWEFHVLNSPIINAFALPGGKVFISRGLMEQMTNEAQLAGVLGHEIGHVTDRHIGERMGQAMGISVLAAGLGIAGQVSDNDWLTVLGAGAGAGGGLYLLSFGRDQETTADRLGVRYMTQLGYNPVGQIQTMQILADASGQGQRSPEFFSTHPYPETRIESLEKLIKDKYPGYNDPAKYAFRQDAFEKNILEPLKKLPPAPEPKKQAGGVAVERVVLADGREITVIVVPHEAAHRHGAV